MAVEIVHCTSCGARIWWAMTLGGKRMPLDEVDHPDGNVAPVITAEGARRVKVLTGTEMPAQGKAWRAHFTTCPNSAEHRKRKAASVPKCRACGFRLDPFLVEQGANLHINCGIPGDLRDALKTSAAGERGEALPAAEPDLMGGAW